MNIAKFVLVFLCYTMALCIHAHTIPVSSLIDTKWECEKGDGDKEILEFKKDSLFRTLIFTIINKAPRMSYPYYLSNDKSAEFDMKKVGRSTSGKYLFEWNSEMNDKNYCEITSLTKDTLVIYWEPKPINVGGGGKWTYVRVR